MLVEKKTHQGKIYMQSNFLSEVKERGTSVSGSVS